MKKIMVIFAVAAVLAALVGACKIADPCPAYPHETSVEQVESRI
jgi:hypothetical protein